VDIGKGENLAKGSTHVVLSACDENATGNDRFLRFPLEDLMLVNQFEDVLGSVCHILAHVDGLAVSHNLLVAFHQVLLTLVKVGVVLYARQCSSRLGVAKSDRSVKMFSVHKLILSPTNTTWIIASLIVIGKGAPFGSIINDAGTNDNTTALTDHVSAGKLLDQVGWDLLAIRTAEDVIQILFEAWPLLGIAIWRKHLGLVRLRSIDVVDFVKDFSCLLRLPSFLSQLDSLPGYRCTSRRRL
jgi:hypothetical protein